MADFTRVLAGPLATMTLGDLGADVIKVESPAGDETRTWKPPEAADGTATYFLSVNRNKRSIALDLADPADNRLAVELAHRADVLVANFKPGTLERFGLGFEELSAANPRLVHCSITGFGTGPGAALPGYDPLVQALSRADVDHRSAGRRAVEGRRRARRRDRGPRRHGLDPRRARRARAHRARASGSRSTCSRARSPRSSTRRAATSTRRVVPRRLGNVHPSIEPFATYAAADGPLMICAGNDRQFAALAAALGEPELSADERFATNPARVEHRARAAGADRRPARRSAGRRVGGAAADGGCPGRAGERRRRLPSSSPPRSTSSRSTSTTGCGPSPRRWACAARRRAPGADRPRSASTTSELRAWLEAGAG